MQEQSAVWLRTDGHGFLRVPWSVFKTVYFIPSVFSVHDGEYVYLEEDCDGPNFLRECPDLKPSEPYQTQWEVNEFAQYIDILFQLGRNFNNE